MTSPTATITKVGAVQPRCAPLKATEAGLSTDQGAVRHSHLDYSLDEFTFRFNRRTSASRDNLFYRLQQHAAEIVPHLVMRR